MKEGVKAELKNMTGTWHDGLAAKVLALHVQTINLGLGPALSHTTLGDSPDFL